MKDMRNVQAPDKLMGVATLLASVPKGVWYAATFFVFSLIGITAWVFHNNLDLVMKIIAYSIVVLVATAIITFYARLIYKAVMGVNSLSMASIDKKRWRALTLKAEARAHKAVAEAHNAVLEVDMGYRYLAGMIERSIDGGKNYEYLGFKSNDRFSNVHTLQEGQLTPQIAQRSNFVPPTFADLVSTNKIIPGEETSILGYVDGEEKRDRWNKLYSFMVFGISGSGKSSTVAYYVALAVYHGARVFLIDPESEEDDSITKRLAPISHLFLVPVGATPTSARHVLAVAKQELDNPSDFPVIFIIDEFSTLMRKADVKGDEWGELGPTLKELVEDYAQRGRKRNRVAIVIGQIAGASRTGGTE